MKTMNAKFLQGRLRMCSALAVLAASAGLLSAQSLVSRIASEANSSEMTLIRGSEHPGANPANEAGRVPAGNKLDGMTMMFSRSAAQEAELSALLAAQQDPTSPQYHQWITSDQFAARFGMAQADLDKVSSWLERQGFTVDTVNRSRNAIHFSGSVGQVESAFQTQLHYYTAGGEKHFAPATALSIPSAFATVVSGVRNLTDFRPRPQHIVPRTNFTSGSSGNVFFAPPDIVKAYDIGPLYTGGVDGTGQTIAIMGQSFIKLSDIEAFQSAAGLTKKDPTLVLVPGTGTDGVVSLGDEGESDLDLEWSNAMAPGATVKFVYTGSNTTFGVYDSAQYAVDQKIGDIISLSYSSCETEFASAASLILLDAIFVQAAAQGQTVMAASGDAGSTACAGATNLSPGQQQAITVNYPASSAFVTGVGGTAITASEVKGGSNFSTYWTTNGTSDVIPSLIKYIPEVVWNDSSSTNGLSSTGGGASALIGKPSYQAALTPSDGKRDVPDISFYSSPGFPGYLYCTSDTSAWQSGQTASCNSGFRDSSTKDLTVAGGTSFATPIFAGMVALLNQKLNYTTGQGLINPTLYSLAGNSATYAAAFHDVASGNNNCSAGATLCGATTGGFSAGAGYDLVTGLGSVDLTALAAVWPASGSVSTIGTITSIVPSSMTPTVSTAVTFSITVAANNSTSVPTGTVSISVDGGTASSATLDSKGAYTLSQTFSTTGTHKVSATYGGNGSFAASGTATASVSVQGTSSGTGTITLAATNVTVTRGSSGNSTLTVTPAGGYTGTVDLTFTTSNNNALTNLCYTFTTITTGGIGTVAVTGTAAVTTQLTLDTQASDCAALTKGTGNHVFKAFHAPGGKMRSDNRTPGGKSLPAGLAFAGLVLAGFMARGSRRLRGLACVIALGAVGMAMSACGGGGGGGGGGTTATNPPKGTYTVTVTGTDSLKTTITANTTFTFTIN